MNKRQITAKMENLGIAWATRSDKYVDPNDGFGAKPTYHVHPDSSYPHQNDIIRFSNLGEVSEYVNAREAAHGADTMEEYAQIMDDWRNEHYCA